MTYRDLRQHLLDQGRGVFGHAASAATGTEAAALAGEGQEALEGAVGAPKPCEAMGEDTTAEEGAELLLDEARQAVSVAAGRDFAKEGFEVVADDGVEDGVFAVTRLIRAVRMSHTLA